MHNNSTPFGVNQRSAKTSPPLIGDLLFLTNGSTSPAPVAPHRSKRDYALAMAKRGFRVFPLTPNGKTPAQAGDWRKIASSHAVRVAEMWTDPVFDSEQDWNIGIALDQQNLVVDVDVRDGKLGNESLESLEDIHGDLLDTLTVETPSGGEHQYFTTVAPVANSASKVGTHIDIKSFGGFVVGPGSVIDGVPYRIISDVPPAAAPEWLITLAGAPRTRDKVDTATPLVELDSDAAIKRATEWLANGAPEAGTFAVAAKVKDFGVSRERCLGLLMDHWPPAEAKGEAHVEFRVDNAYRYGQNAPGIASAEAEFDAVPMQDKLRGGIQLEQISSFDAIDIPKRQWVLGKFVARNYLSGLVSPPGVGKTTFLLMVAVAIATGRSDIVGMHVHERGRVLLWNQEDETNELKRRLLAVMQAFDVQWKDLEIDGKPAITIGSGVDRRLMFAIRDSNGGIKPAPDAKTLEDHIRAEGIAVAIFDPFVEMHAANENDNTEVAVVGSVFRRIAVNANCAVILAHHTRKPPQAAASDAYAGNMDTARGAGALNGVARMVATLYGIDAATGKKYGIPDAECRRFIRFDDAKANMSLTSGEPMFFRREGVTIGGFGGEEVGVLRPVKMTAEKTTKEAKEDEKAAIREASRRLLREVPDHRLAVTDIARSLLEAGVVESTSLDTLTKRLKLAIFSKPQKFENGDLVALAETARLTGRKGRVAKLVGTFAEN